MRLDVGTSLGYRGSDPAEFFAHADETAGDEVVQQLIDSISALHKASYIKAIEAMVIDAIAKSIGRVSDLVADDQHECRAVGASIEEFRTRVRRWLDSVPLPPQIGAAAGAPARP